MRILIRNGHVIDPVQGLDEKLDILIEKGVITRIGMDLGMDGEAPASKMDDGEPQELEVIDAEGKLVFPGFIDMHCHLRDPGYEYKEDIRTGTRSAAAGGFTSIACMPNTQPVVDNEAIVRYIADKAKREGYVNVYPIGCITKGSKGEELSEIGELKFAGAVAISDDGKPVKNSNIMRRALQYAAMFDMPVISHCEDPDLADEGVMNEGATSTFLGLKGIPAASEEVMVARELILSEYTGAPIHIAHVSTRGSVNLIRDAKRRGVKVTCETCPHYFTLTEEMCGDFNTLAKVNPPLRTQKDMEAVIEGLRDGTIDVIATDHAPHHIDEKNVEFAQAANGFIGFETALPLSITYLVKPGILTYGELVQKMSVKPAAILGLDKGTLRVGQPADITIIDPEEQWTVDVDKFKSKARNSPYGGFTLYGIICYTLVEGKIVVREKEVE